MNTQNVGQRLPAAPRTHNETLKYIRTQARQGGYVLRIVYNAVVNRPNQYYFVLRSTGNRLTRDVCLGTALNIVESGELNVIRDSELAS